MTKQKAIYRHPDDSEIPIELTVLVGLITIRFGQLERILMNVYCRQLEPNSDPLEVIAELKDNFKTLAKRIEHIEGAFEEKRRPAPAWLDFNCLKELAKERNAIHDALLVNGDGHLYWLSGSKKRNHRPASLRDLEDLRDRLTGMLCQINADSLSNKRAG